jgi:glycerate-2-kinase
MKGSWIKNFKELAVTENRRLALKIIEAGFSSIDTQKIINSSISLQNEILKIKNHQFNLKNFKSISVIGFGKVSCRAAYELEKILGSRIRKSAVIGLKKITCEYIKTYQGTHPKPSPQNVKISQKILELARHSDKDDLVIVIVSGGGSALLCWPKEECEQGQQLYDKFLATGGTIRELNTVRRHLSLLKGGGLAKILYPSQVIGLIFSDIPGENPQQVASGPTFKDETTTNKAREIIKKYRLGKFNLIETPKQDRYFKKVTNIVLVSNKTALQAMRQKAASLGFKAKIISSQIYDFPEKTLVKFFKNIKGNEALIGGGEIRLIVKTKQGSGGRNQFLALEALHFIGKNQVFISIASDGLDNSEAAGAIADQITIQKANQKNLNFKAYLKRYDSYSFFEKTGDLIFTGPTEANVADLIILVSTKRK